MFAYLKLYAFYQRIGAGQFLNVVTGKHHLADNIENHLQTYKIHLSLCGWTPVQLLWQLPHITNIFFFKQIHSRVKLHVPLV